MTEARECGPYISVHIPAKNAERYLVECLDSVLSQSYPNFEVLVGDDRSEDGTRQLVAGYASRDPRIRLFSHNGPPGSSSCRNLLLRHARSDARYIAVLDADDICLPGRLEHQLQYLEEHQDLALLGTAIEYMNRESKIIGRRNYPVTPAQVQRTKLIYNPFAASSVMMRTQVVRSLGGYEEGRQRLDDYHLWLRMLDRYKGANLPEALVRYRLLGTEKAKKAKLALREGCRLKLKHATARDFLRPHVVARWTGEAMLSTLPGPTIARLFLLSLRVKDDPSET